MKVSKALKETLKIRGVSITNFKGIAKCNIENIARINLVLGKNDSGKSSILEAIFFTFKEYIGNTLGDIMSRRTDVFTGGREIWFKYNIRHPINISAKLESGSTIGLRLTMVKTQISTTLYGSYGGIDEKKPRWRIPGSTYMGTDFTFSMGAEKIARIPIHGVNKSELARFASNIVFIDGQSKSMISGIETELAKIKYGGKSRAFGKILKKCYGKGQSWEFLPHLDTPDQIRLTFKEAGRSVFASDLGDGFRLGLFILSMMFNRTNTCFLIEEIENHQHLGSLRQLLKTIVEIAGRNNLQVFITTHSADTWECLSRGVYLDDIEREKREFRCFVTERNVRNGIVSAEHTEDITKINRALGHP